MAEKCSGERETAKVADYSGLTALRSNLNREDRPNWANKISLTGGRVRKLLMVPLQSSDGFTRISELQRVRTERLAT